MNSKLFMALLLQAAPDHLIVAIPCVVVKIAVAFAWVMTAITGMMLMTTGRSVLYDDGSLLSFVKLSLIKEAGDFKSAVYRDNLRQPSRAALKSALVFDFRFMRWLYPAIMLTSLFVASCSCLGMDVRWYWTALAAAALGALTWVADRRENKATLRALEVAWANDADIDSELQPMVSTMRRWSLAKWIIGGLCSVLLLVLFGAWIGCGAWWWQCGC